MVEPKIIIDALGVDRELVLEFFAYFSRFEYALKQSDFLKPGDKAKPDWKGYANSLQGRFKEVQTPKFLEAVRFLLTQPPGTQVRSRNDLGWDKTVRRNREHDEGYVLRLVRTLRNNLFHGGKYPPGPVPDEGRNQSLLVAAIAVLGGCLDLSPGVRGAFEETG